MKLELAPFPPARLSSCSLRGVGPFVEHPRLFCHCGLILRSRKDVGCHGPCAQGLCVWGAAKWGPEPIVKGTQAVFAVAMVVADSISEVYKVTDS